MDRRSYLRALSAGIAGLAGCATVVDTRTTRPRTTTPANQVAYRIETMTMNLQVPWGSAFQPTTGDLYVTERPGRVRKLKRTDGEFTGEKRTLVADLTDAVSQRGDGGLLGLAFHPNEPSVAFTFQTEATPDGPVNRVVRHDVTDGFSRHGVVVDDIPAGTHHNGGRLAFGPDGALFVTTGDAGTPTAAQNTDSLAGKVLRVLPDGDPHPDNPFGNAVFTYGHRNPQGLTFHPQTGEPYCTDRGPNVDEVNVLRTGHDYGWPNVMGRGTDTTDPLATFSPPVGPAGATFYDGSIEDWQGDLFVGTLSGTALYRLTVDPRTSNVSDRQRLLSGEYGRLRSTFVGRTGNLYVTTSNRGGTGEPAPQDDRILRILPS